MNHFFKDTIDQNSQRRNRLSESAYLYERNLINNLVNNLPKQKATLPDGLTGEANTHLRKK